MQDLSVEFVCELYERYALELKEVRAQQRALYLNSARGWKAQLDDVEAEITYLLVRHYQPKIVAEIGSLHGWSTTWMLRAIRANGHGVLHTFDLIDNVVRTVPGELRGDRWHFRHGDIRDNLSEIPVGIEYLFIDAEHTGRFAKWYTENLIPLVDTGTPVCVHDIYRHRVNFPGGEPAVVLAWLSERGVPWFTSAQAKAPAVLRELVKHRHELGLAEPIHHSERNPMIFFNAP